MRWGTDAQKMIFEGATPGIKFALGENPKRAGNPVGGGRGTTVTATPARYPATLHNTATRKTFLPEHDLDSKDYSSRPFFPARLS